MKKIEIMCHLIGCNENTVISVIFLLKIQKLNQVMRKHRQSKLKDILLNNWPAIFKNVKIIKVKESLRNYFSVKDTKRHNITQDFKLDPLSIQDVLGQLKKH